MLKEAIAVLFSACAHAPSEPNCAREFNHTFVSPERNARLKIHFCDGQTRGRVHDAKFHPMQYAELDELFAKLLQESDTRDITIVLRLDRNKLGSEWNSAGILYVWDGETAGHALQSIKAEIDGRLSAYEAIKFILRAWRPEVKEEDVPAEPILN